MTDRPEDGTMYERDAEDALDRLLALRDDDLDGWEVEAADGLDPDARAAAEAADAEFAALLEAWVDVERAAPEPALTARDILERDERTFDESSEPVRLRRRRSADHGLRRLTAALVAALMLVAVGSWIVALQPTSDTFRTKALVTSESAARLDLQFSVERPEGVVPGTFGTSLGSDESLAMRMDVRGAGGWLSLHEVSADGTSRMLYPLGGEALQVDIGTHALVSDAGNPLVYRPDAGVGGTTRYVALLTREPIDPARVMPGVLGAGVDRADLWPRPVLAVDEFTVDWR